MRAFLADFRATCAERGSPDPASLSGFALLALGLLVNLAWIVFLVVVFAGFLRFVF